MLGFTQIKLTKKEYKDIFNNYRNFKFTKKEFYKKDNLYLAHYFTPWYIKLICIVLYPILILIYGISNIRELNKKVVVKMRAFKKTLDFINSCSLEELTKELVKYGVVFEENMALKNNVPDSIYEKKKVNISRTIDILRWNKCYQKKL